MRIIRTDRGFSLTELLLVVVVLGILLAVAIPKTSRVLQSAGASQTASLVALDLERAVTLAVRSRKPVRIACDCAGGSYSITDRNSGTVLVTRQVTGGTGQLNVQSIAFSTLPVDVFPSGRTTSSLTVTLSSGDAIRLVTMSVGGFVRVVH